jgi:hypothetical protein
MAKKSRIVLVSLGYSGGAAPDLHRSSLFVGRFQRERPTTNAQCNKGQSYMPRAMMSSKAKIILLQRRTEHANRMVAGKSRRETLAKG